MILTIFLIKLYFGLPLEPSHSGDFNEYTQYMILSRTDENYPLSNIKYPAYLADWFHK